MDTGMDKRAVSCVLLAAGAGLRFGGGKLLAEFDGERLFERAMNVLPEEELVDTDTKEELRRLKEI